MLITNRAKVMGAIKNMMFFNNSGLSSGLMGDVLVGGVVVELVDVDVWVVDEVEEDDVVASWTLNTSKQLSTYHIPLPKSEKYKIFFVSFLGEGEKNFISDIIAPGKPKIWYQPFFSFHPKSNESMEINMVL